MVICLNCGDKGFSNALVYCVNCLGVAVHRYCLDKVTFHEFVNWVCDDCEKNELTIMNSDAIPPETDLVEHSHAVQPVHDPTWRGCFNISNKKYELDGVVAHLSVKATQSVSEKAKLLLLHLHFEMVPKSYLWPKCFNTSEATGDDIELYFFPADSRHEQEFDRLVEDMIGGEHVLRAFTPHEELLIFTSTELPLRHWRYQQKYYLWGIFKATEASSSHQTPETVLAIRDEINVVNNRTPTEVDTQVVTDVLRRGKRIKMRNARLADYV